MANRLNWIQEELTSLQEAGLYNRILVPSAARRVPGW